MEKKWPLVHTASVDDAASARTNSFTHPAAEGVIEAWPKETHALEERQRDWSVILYDTILVLLPLCLFAKIMIVVAFSNKQAEFATKETIAIVQFNGQLVTLFTVIFGTIVATLVRRYALWKAQKGASVAELEQLHSSVSLPRTLSLVWSLRSWTLTSVSLILMWLVLMAREKHTYKLTCGGPGTISVLKQSHANSSSMTAIRSSISESCFQTLHSLRSLKAACPPLGFSQR